MPGKDATHALLILKNMRETLGTEEKLYVNFVDVAKTFDRVPRKVTKRALKKKGLPEVWVQGSWIRVVGKIWDESLSTSRVGAITTDIWYRG